MKAYKVELKLNNKQITNCKKHCGAARFAYNWGLKTRQEAFKNDKISLNAISLHKELNTKKEKEFPWMYETSKCAPQEALRDLDKAFNNFFRRVQEKKKGKKINVGYPKFKSKKQDKWSFRLTGSIKIFSGKIQLPRLGKLRIYEKNYIPLDAKVLSVTITKEAEKWFASILVDEPKEVSKFRNQEDIKDKDIVGIDLGIKSLAILSDGQIIENPKTLYKRAKKLSKYHKAVSRKIKNSKNRNKARKQLAKEYQKVSNIRRDYIEKVTTAIIKQFKLIGIEALNVKGMMRNHHLAKSIQDASWGFFKRKLEDKAKRQGVLIAKSGRFYPSSKTCSKCGVIKETLELSERTFVCENCGNTLDRDLNAAINLRLVALSFRETLNALGDDVRLPQGEAVVYELGNKQELAQG